THAAIGGGSPLIEEVLHVALLKNNIGWKIGVIGIVPGNRGIVGDTDTVASSGQIGVGRSLRAIFIGRITVEYAATSTQVGRPADHGNGDHRLRPAVLAVGDKRIRRGAG